MNGLLGFHGEPLLERLHVLRRQHLRQQSHRVTLQTLLHHECLQLFSSDGLHALGHAQRVAPSDVRGGAASPQKTMRDRLRGVDPLRRIEHEQFRHEIPRVFTHGFIHRLVLPS